MRVLFKRVDGPKDRKLRFNGPCEKCGVNTDHRLSSMCTRYTTYKCLKCKTLNKEVI